MDVKKYRFSRAEREKAVHISRNLHNAIRVIANEMECSIQEATYRLVVRGMQWYMLNVKPKAEAERDAEWVRSPGADLNPNDGRKRYSGSRRFTKFPPINTQQPPLVNNSPKETPSIPDDWFPGDL